jgi:hypothetical protein
MALIINCIMSDLLTDEEVSKSFFKEHLVKPGDVIFQCRECERQITRVKVRGGWSMLKQHVKTHKQWKAKCITAKDSGRMYDFVTKRVSDAIINAFKWLEWIIMEDLPFSFVDNTLTRKNVALDPISRPTLDEIHESLGDFVEQKIKESLPPTFGLVVDGWTCNKKHYFAIFASYTVATSGVVKLPLLCCGVQDEDEDSDLNFSAESQDDYIFDELQLLGYDFNAIEFICGDNTSCHPK